MIGQCSIGIQPHAAPSRAVESSAGGNAIAEIAAKRPSKSLCAVNRIPRVDRELNLPNLGPIHRVAKEAHAAGAALEPGAGMVVKTLGERFRQ